MRDIIDLSISIKNISNIEDNRTTITKEFESYVLNILVHNQNKNNFENVNNKNDNDYMIDPYRDIKNNNKRENLDGEIENNLYLKKLEEYGKNTQDLNNETKEIINSLEKELIKLNDCNIKNNDNYKANSTKINLLIENIKTLLIMERKNFELLILFLQIKIKCKNIQRKVDYEVGLNKLNNLNNKSSHENYLKNEISSNPISNSNLNTNSLSELEIYSKFQKSTESKELLNREIIVKYLLDIEKCSEEANKIECQLINHRNNINELLTEMKYQFI
jgi:hypothetical protein